MVRALFTSPPALAFWLLVFVILAGFFAIVGVVDAWPRLELMLHGAAPV